MGRSERESIENRLQTLLTYLLKWQYDRATEPRRGWRITIRNTRKGIAKKAKASLKDYPEHYLETISIKTPHLTIILPCGTNRERAHERIYAANHLGSP